MTLREFGEAVGAAIKAVTKPIGDFLNKHWVSVAVVLLGLIVFAAAMTLLVFAWPGVIAVVGAATVTLPIIGTIAPLAFLSSLSIPAAAAVLSTAAFVGFVAASGLVIGAINLLHTAYKAVDKWFTKNVPDEARDTAIDAAQKGMEEVSRNAYDAGFIAATSSFHKGEFTAFIKANRIPSNNDNNNNNNNMGVNPHHFNSPLRGTDPNPFNRGRNDVVDPLNDANSFMSIQ
jgi:hypothetical protein